MPSNLLILRTADGRHSLPCPPGASVDLGSDPACEVVLEGEGILPRHCVLNRTGDTHFQITAFTPTARFTVNNVSASDLSVEVPFTFGIDGETIEFDLGVEADAEAPPADAPHMPAEPPAKAVEPSSLTPRANRRGYLLQPPAVKPRVAGRVGEVVLVQPGSTFVPPPLPVEEVPPETLPPSEPPPAPAAKADDEESSPLLFAGLVLCGLMIFGVLWWQRHVDAVFSSVGTQAAAPVATHLPTDADIMAACRDLRLAGLSTTAAHLQRPLAGEGHVQAMHELAGTLHQGGGFSEEAMLLHQQAAEGGLRAAWGDLVRQIDHADNPARHGESAFQQLKRAAELGEPSAWMPLGERYELGTGTGTAPDLALALAAYEKAQAAGDPRAQPKLTAKDAALHRVEAFVRSWNEVSVATLLDHVSATPGRFFLLEHPPIDALLRMEEELRTRWPLRRISVAPGAQAEMQTFDLIKVTQPFQFELENGARLARGTGILTCAVQRDTEGVWRITAAADAIEATDLRPSRDKFVSATSLRTLSPVLAREEQMEESRQQLLRELRGIEETQDFKAALTALTAALREFPQEAYWRPFADQLCDRMARQFFAEARWLDATWAQQVHQLAENGSVSAMLLEGHLLAAGYGCQRDEARSIALYEKAFEAGKRRDARFYYAEALFQGRGTPPDLAKAGTLVFPFMTRSKHPLEAYLAAHLMWRKAETEPALWQQIYDTLSRVAEKHPPARHLAAMVLLNHGNTTRERKTGFAALKATAEAGVQEAMKNLAKCYQDGIGCQPDLQAATLWKQKAAITEPPRRKHYTEWAE